MKKDSTPYFKRDISKTRCTALFRARVPLEHYSTIFHYVAQSSWGVLFHESMHLFLLESSKSFFFSIPPFFFFFLCNNVQGR